MKKTIILALALALTLPAASSAAISVFASYWDTDELGEGIGIGARLGFSILPRVQIELGATYFDQLDRELTLGPLSIDVEVDLEVIPLDVGVRLDLGRRGGFYVGGGLSYLLLDSDLGELDDEVGVYGTLGIQFRRIVFVEVIYREVEGTFDSTRLGPQIPTAVDVGLGGFGVNLGFRF